ncbi:MAG: hypothetical protein ACOC1O_05795 [bacterium]
MTELQEKILKLINEGKTYNDIEIELKCSKSTISSVCKKNNIKRNNTVIIPDKLLNKIQKEYDNGISINKLAKKYGFNRKTLSKKLNKIIFIKKTNKELKESNVNNVIYWRNKVKKKLIKYKGGECLSCGYNKCIQNLQFHHINPNEKDFTIGGKSYSYERLKKESDKCILLCSNCHTEIHYNLIDINNLIKKEEQRINNIPL